MATFVAGDALGGVNFDAFDLTTLLDGSYLQRSSTFVSIDNYGAVDNFYGSGFKFNSQELPSAGTIARVHETYGGQTVFNLTDISIPVPTFMQWVLSGDNGAALRSIFAGADSIAGSNHGDVLGGFAGADTIAGGNGPDSIVGFEGQSYLRGDAGDDVIVGGADFDDINGNMGDDTASGGGGGDWVVGGKDDDILLGDAGDDIVYGNMGLDICSGGEGRDIVRGGQGDDGLLGDDGDDWMSGDRGADTVAGGLGADTFHSFSGAGIDLVTDFSRAQGDRVQLDAGTTYTVVQSGADTVIDMGNGDRLVLAGVQSSSLTGDWIFVL